MYPKGIRVQFLYRGSVRFYRALGVKGPCVPMCRYFGAKVSTIRVVVRIMVPSWIPIIIRHLLFRVPKKGTIILATTHLGTWTLCLKDEKTLKRNGPIPLYYKSLYRL